MRALPGKLENTLADAFKTAPKIPENGRKSLVQWMPWIALIFGALQFWSARALWRLSDRVDDLRFRDEVARQFGLADTTPDLNQFYWLALIILTASGVILLLAYPGLRDRKKAGWNWIYYGEILTAVYAVISLFFDNYYGGGFGRFIGSAIGVVIGLYLLFQIRDHYRAKGALR